MLDTSMCQKPAARMNFRGIRSSKFRHVYGQPAKKVRIVSTSEFQKTVDLCFSHNFAKTCFSSAQSKSAVFFATLFKKRGIQGLIDVVAGEMLRGGENQSKCSRLEFLLGQPKVPGCCCRGID